MKDSDFELLVTSVKQAGRIRRGEMAPARKFEVRPEDVKAIRAQLNKSQSEFALMIGVSVSTLQNWEQGRRQPEGACQSLTQGGSGESRSSGCRAGSEARVQCQSRSGWLSPTLNTARIDATNCMTR